MIRLYGKIFKIKLEEDIEREILYSNMNLVTIKFKPSTFQLFVTNQANTKQGVTDLTKSRRVGT